MADLKSAGRKSMEYLVRETVPGSVQRHLTDGENIGYYVKGLTFATILAIAAYNAGWPHFSMPDWFKPRAQPTAAPTAAQPSNPGGSGYQ